MAPVERYRATSVTMAMPFCDGDGFGPITDNHVNTCFQQAVVGIVPVAFLAIFGTMRLVQVSALPRVMSPLSCRLGTKGFLSVMMYVRRLAPLLARPLPLPPCCFHVSLVLTYRFPWSACACGGSAGTCTPSRLS